MHALHTLPPLKAVIDRYQLFTRKALGQHFLLDANITDKVALAAGDLTQGSVIEIGPGPGGLTRSLLMAGAREVIAVEKDERCIAALEDIKAVSEGRLTIFNADALEVDVTTLGAAPRRIVANLPYNVGTPLLVKWLHEMHAGGADAIHGMTLMFQKEVADRIAAEPGSKDYGRLSVLSQWLCEVAVQFDLPPGAFSPPPKVWSSVINLVPRATREACELRALERVTEAAFGQRRKMLRGSLKSLGVNAEALLEQAGIPPTERAEQLSVAEFCRLARLLTA